MTVETDRSNVLVGTLQGVHRIQGFLTGGSGNVAPSGGQILAMLVACAPGQIRTVMAAASSKGTGATIIDLQKNGTSVWRDPTHRPTLTTSAGRFFGYIPDDRIVQIGDILTLIVIQSSPGSTGVVATAAIEEPWA